MMSQNIEMGDKSTVVSESFFPYASLLVLHSPDGLARIIVSLRIFPCSYAAGFYEVRNTNP